MVFTCACACAYSLHESIQEQGCVCREPLYIHCRIIHCSAITSKSLILTFFSLICARYDLLGIRASSFHSFAFLKGAKEGVTFKACFK